MVNIKLISPLCQCAVATEPEVKGHVTQCQLYFISSFFFQVLLQYWVGYRFEKSNTGNCRMWIK